MLNLAAHCSNELFFFLVDHQVGVSLGLDRKSEFWQYLVMLDHSNHSNSIYMIVMWKFGRSHFWVVNRLSSHFSVSRSCGDDQNMKILCLSRNFCFRVKSRHSGSVVAFPNHALDHWVDHEHKIFLKFLVVSKFRFTIESRDVGRTNGFVNRFCSHDMTQYVTRRWIALRRVNHARI